MEENKQIGCKNNVWFVSDLHFSHKNILKIHPRRCEMLGVSLDEVPIEDLIELHDKYLIELWNITIKRDDIVYILGDLSLGTKERTKYILQQLRGKKFLIRGNHDKSCQGLENYFEWVGDLKEVKFTNNQYRFIDPSETFCVELCHYPMFTWNRRPHGTCNVHGHCHGSCDDINLKLKELRVDVGFDSKLANHDFVPLKQLYEFFINLRNSYGCSSFQEYADKLNEELKYRG